MKRFPKCILATCCVPWDERGEFLEELFRDQVRELLAHATKHLYILGTAGEGYAVSEPQFDRIVRVFCDGMRSGGAEPMVGVISLSLPTVIERIERARDVGVRQFQISLPSWGPLSEPELSEFFCQTCGRFRDCQFLHYNLMRTKRLVTPRDYARLAVEHPNLVATKNSTDSMDRIEELLTLAPQLQHCLNETGYVYGSMIGECALLSSLANVNYSLLHAFFDAGECRDSATRLAMQRELSALGRDLAELVGGTAHMDGAFDKMLWRMHDRRFPLRLLSPYSGVTEECFDRFTRLVTEKYPRWQPE
jgi:dihydrodipicolinate synthase/N-acetylneuraminate lyase